MALSDTSSRYEIEFAIEQNSVDFQEAKKKRPSWFTVVAEFSNSKGERGWSTINTVSNETGDATTFVTDDENLAEFVAQFMIEFNDLPAYVRTLRGTAIGLPEGDSPYWDYKNNTWKKNPVIF